VQIAWELGISPSMLRNWRNRRELRMRGRHRSRFLFRIWRQKSPGFAARTIAYAWSATF
jgi:hypothetical protein